MNVIRDITISNQLSDVGGLEREEGSPATDFFKAVVERLNKEIFYRKEIQKVKGVWRFGRNSKVQD